MPNGLAIPGGVTFPILAPDGSAAAPSYSFTNGASSGLFLDPASAGVGLGPTMSVLGAPIQHWDGNTGLSIVHALYGRAWGSSAFASPDLFLYRDAANTLAQRNTTNNQTSRVYGTYTDASNGRWIALTGHFSSSMPGIYADGNGTGANPDLYIGIGSGTGTIRFYTTAATTAWQIQAAGHLVCPITNTIDIGATGALPRSIYAGTSFAAPTGYAPSACAFTWQGNPSYGICFTGTQTEFVANGAGVFEYFPGSLRSFVGLTFGISYSDFSAEVHLKRLAVASLGLGGAPSATPVAQTFTIGEASRPGTDSNVGGSSGTIRSGLGTGTGTLSTLILQTPVLAASGSTTQTYRSMVVVDTDVGITVGVGNNDGIGIAFGSISNQPRIGRGNNSLLIYPSVALPAKVEISPTTFAFTSDVSLAWHPGTSITSVDTALARLGAASIRQGFAPSATPVAQTFTIGEASRPGTDSNVAGANGTIRSGLGTGNATGSSLIFQTPTAVGAGSSVQTYSDVLTLTTSQATFNGTQVTFGNAGAGRSYFNTSIGLVYGSGLQIQWGNNTDAGAGASDLSLARLAAASLRQGLAPSATPVNQTFTIGESSRGGTDLNVAGANGILRSGLGTGNAAGTSLIFQVSVPLGSSTVAQTYTQVMSLSALGATFDIPDQGLRINGQVSGAGAGAGTLTNAPAAGNPNFWLPINCGGTVFFFPGW